MLIENGIHALIIVQDITNIIISQQMLSDKIYKEAILTNYSHE